MKFTATHADGCKSLDRKIAKLVTYVNERVSRVPNDYLAEEEAITWARQTIERGIRNLADNMFADRVE